MPRRVRLEFEGAIYHLVGRGKGGQIIAHDDRDRSRFVEDLGHAVVRTGWEVFAFVLMPDHFHILLKTPRANLARGMQGFLSAYAHWCLRSRGRAGRLFQGRYRADMIEDESYYWDVSRHIHLNPVRAELVDQPEDWAWSSYPGYMWRKSRAPWVAYDSLLNARQHEGTAKDASAAYRQYVRAGASNPPPSPFAEALDGWVLGSKRYRTRLRSLEIASERSSGTPMRDLSGLDAEVVCEEVSGYYGLDPESLARRHDRELTAVRAMAAWLCRRYTEATLRELALRFGLSRADSVPNLTRWFEATLPTSRALSGDLKKISQAVTERAAGQNDRRSTAGARSGKTKPRVRRLV